MKQIQSEVLVACGLVLPFIFMLVDMNCFASTKFASFLLAYNDVQG